VQQGTKLCNYIQGLRRTSPATTVQDLAQKKSHQQKNGNKKQKKGNQ
jgi:hypothetical protein